MTSAVFAEVSVESRVQSLDWARLAADLDAHGCAVMPKILSPEDCRALAATYADEAPFRSRIVMARHGFGCGEYKYWAYPLPESVATLRALLYPHLAEVANRWNQTLGIDLRYPQDHADFLAQCHAAGQTRPTPLLLQYGEGDYNCLHQDLYGDLAFPLQAAFLSPPREPISPEENSSSPSSAPACNPAPRWSP